MTAQTITPMKRAGQLIAHLGVLHQISDVRQLLLLQLVMRERQDQVALFRRSEQDVTLNLIGAQAPLNSSLLTHRAGTVPAVALLDQLQTLSGIQGNDVAFSSGQINDLITTRTQAIEQSDELARLDVALTAMITRGLQEASLQPAQSPPPAAQPQRQQPQAQQAEPLPQEPKQDQPDYTLYDLDRHAHEDGNEAFHDSDGEEIGILQPEDLANNIPGQIQGGEEPKDLNRQAPDDQVSEELRPDAAESLPESQDAAEVPQEIPAPATRRGRRPA